uniref:F-box domain-containing protein n=1 Tax=Graphocephala atropunctata TaxID=36148 RepID=A0A1B6LTU1_9HEMI
MESSQTKHVCSLENLFPEVVEIIAASLTVKDLAACSAVSRRMREVFNSDVLWRRHCDQDLAEYLRTTPCKVEPPFVSPESEDSTLSPVCYWRMAFMRENHLWNNWRLGICKTEEFKTQQTGYLCQQINQPFLTNDIILSLSSDTLEVFNVKQTLFEEVVQPISLLRNGLVDRKIVGTGNKIIVMYSSYVQVYKLDFITGDSSLDFTFYVDEPEKLNIKDVNEFRREFLTREISGTFDGFITVEGKYFVAVCQRESVMHIWDLETGMKLKEENFCPSYCNTNGNKGSGTNNLILSFSQSSVHPTIFLSYSLTDLAYLPFRVELDGRCRFDVHNEFIGIHCNFSFTIYNYLTSTRLFICLQDPSSPNNRCVFPQHSYILGNYFLYLDNDVLKFFNPLRQRVELCLEGIKSFVVLYTNLVVLRKKCNQIEIISKTLSHVRLDKGFIPLKTTLFTAYSTRKFVNQPLTRFIDIAYSDGSTRIHHFW